MLGIRTRGCMTVGADVTTELWRPPRSNLFMTLAPVGRSVVDRKMKTEDEEDERRRRRRRHLTRVRERPTDICASFENGG